jgi:hypothetical protein
VLILFPLFVAIIGLVIYFAATQNGKVAEVGRIMFAFGLLVFLLQSGPHVASALR